MAQKNKSIEERLSEVQLKQTEKTNLERVFKLLITSPEKKNKNFFNCEYFEGKDIARVLSLLDVKLTKSEIDLMLWVIFFFSNSRRK